MFLCHLKNNLDNINEEESERKKNYLLVSVVGSELKRKRLSKKTASYMDKVIC